MPRRDVFAEILDKCDVVTTPGSGFGPAGEGFVRASAFAHRCHASLVGRWMQKAGTRFLHSLNLLLPASV